jgi:hypothetical protein
VVSSFTRTGGGGEDRDRGGDNRGVRLTVFWERMTAQFGVAYVDSFARDFVLSEVGGRTVHQALADGVGAKEVWAAVCHALDLSR